MKEQISSKNNERIKNTAKLLNQSRFRNEKRQFVAEGLRLCVDAVKSGCKPLEFYYTQKAIERHPDEYGLISSISDNEFCTSEEVFEKLSDTVNPQGFLCVFSMEDKPLISRQDSRYIVTCDIADPANLGAISRTAEALGIDGMIVCGGCDIYNPKALRASMGALFRMQPTSMNIDEMFDFCSRNEIKTYASVAKSSANKLHETDFSGNCAVLIGNEANGLSNELISCCSEQITIYMRGRAESLNAAAAAAILMYEITKN